MKKTFFTSIVALTMSTLAAGAAETTASASNYKVFFGIGGGMHGWNYTGNFETLVDHLIPMATNMIPLGIVGGFSIELPKKELAMGMEGGMRFGKHSDVWNYGFTIAADKTISKNVELQGNTAFKNLRQEQVGSYLNTEGEAFDPSDPSTGAPAFINPKADPSDPDYARKVSEPDYIISTVLRNIKMQTNIISLTFDNYIRLNKSRDHRLDIVLGVGVADIETNMKLLDIGHSSSAHAAVVKAGMEVELTDVVSLTAGSRIYVPVSGQFYSNQYDLKGGIKFVF